MLDKISHRRWTSVVLMVLTMATLLSACGGDGDDVSAASPATTTTAPPAREITVAAASDLRPAFEELGTLFTKETGTKVTFTFGSSGQLREQIVNGAPFDLFASADVGFVDEVIAKGRGVAETKADYAFGRIVLWTPNGVTPPAEIAGLTDAAYRRIAIANPEHAPYGRAAKEALEKAGIYDKVVDRLIYGENISDTFRIAKSGNADVSIVALSLVIADGSDYTLIPAEQHNPLRQALVVTATGAQGKAATAFAKSISSPAGRKAMVHYGFVLPGDSVPGES